MVAGAPVALVQQGGHLMARKRRDSGPSKWFRTVVVGLVAVAALAMATTEGGNGRNVTADGPAGCVVLKVTP